MKQFRFLVLCLLFLPFSGFAQLDSFNQSLPYPYRPVPRKASVRLDSAGSVRLSAAVSWEFPNEGTAEKQKLKSGTGLSLSADIYLTKKIDLTVKYLYKSIPYDAEGLIFGMQAVSGKGSIDIEYNTWNLHAPCVGLRLKTNERGHRRSVIEVFGGAGWYSLPSGGITVTNSLNGGRDFIYLTEVSTDRRDLALGAALKEEIYLGKGRLIGIGISYFTFTHNNSYHLRYNQANGGNGEPKVTERFLEERSAVNLLALNLSLSVGL